MEMKRFSYMVEIDILRNSSQKWSQGVICKGLGVLEGYICGAKCDPQQKLFQAIYTLYIG